MTKNSYILVFLLLISSACFTENEKVNEEVKDQSLSYFLESKSYVKIELNQHKSGHLSLITKLNNVKGRFILDTGSSSTIIDQKLRKKFRLVARHTQKIAKTAGGTQLKMKVSYDNVLEFGSLKLRNVKISLVNLSHINYSFQKMGMHQLDGIIGSDILKNRKAVIDYENLVIYLKKN